MRNWTDRDKKYHAAIEACLKKFEGKLVGEEHLAFAAAWIWFREIPTKFDPPPPMQPKLISTPKKPPGKKKS